MIKLPSRLTFGHAKSERTLYLGIRNAVYLVFFQEKIARIAIDNNQLNLLIFDAEGEEIVQWID
ncbi:element excision factor XisH family protein [Moorena sp. SIO3H5]|uniref:element excision factor XisH family protein n=1 Tax=Moorena sp. SIO3H5 TaxID=2607834 RepID=UPI0025CF5C91|nr:element excision factor XisH family protein [Moorena sp. SIO3H5]